MRFGICAALDALDTVAAAGFEYLEPPVTAMLQPEEPEGKVMPPLQQRFAVSEIKAETFNLLLPGDLKVVGPEIDTKRQEQYLDSAFRRARILGGEIAVFGSGGARRIPDGWPAATAHSQMLAFLKLCGRTAATHQMTVVIEPLNSGECNFINSVAEAVRLSREADHPAIGVLSDLYHITHDNQSYDQTKEAAPWLRHVHVAGQKRRAPGADDFDFLRAYFAVLKAAGYAGRVSIEANWENLEEEAAEAQQVVSSAWDAA